MQLKNRLFLLGAAGVVLGSLVQACATDASTGDDDVVDDAGVADTGTKKDATADTGVADTGTVKDTGADVTVADTGTDTGVADAGRDTGVDAGPADAGPNKPGDLFDPTAPKEGDPCPAGVPENGVMSRGCGYCGTQKSFCTNGKVGVYAACVGENTNPVNRCLPNAARGSSCGICGTQVDDCDPVKCTWTAGVCENELANGCPAGEITYVTGVCPNATDVRKQTCSATCALGAPEPCAPEPIDTINVPTDGSTATGLYKLSAVGATSGYPNGTTCPAATVHSATPYHFALVKNTTAAPVVVEVFPSTPAGGTAVDTVSVAYLGRTTRPRTDAELKACNGAIVDGTSTWSGTGLVGTSAITIPANGTAVVQTAGYTGTATAGKPLQLNVRVQGRPVIDHTITVPAVGASVNQVLDFATADTTGRLYTAFGATQVCPIVPSATLTPYRYIKLNNATAAARTVEVLVGGNAFDGVIASYARSDAPFGAERNACVGSANDTCSDANYDACLNGANAVVVPANGSAVVYVGEYSNHGTAPTAVIRTTN
jgi:hypothetical protein